MTKRVTINDVAREANVSTMTVSRVLNDKEGVSSATRQHVQAVIERLGYRPSNIARGLVTKRTGTLGLVVPDVSNPFFSEVARGAEHVAYAEGYNVFLCNTEEDTERELAVLKSLDEKRVDGVVLCSSRLEESDLEAVVARHPAVVLVNRRLESGNVGVAMINDERGAQAATQHLLQAGHRVIGFSAGPSTSHSSRQRVKGYRAAFTAAGLSYDPGWIRHCPPIVEGGRQTAQALLNDYPELTALFCYNDLVAVGALQTCADLGLRVPEDVAVVGCDDIPLAALITPPLTTIRGPRYELGRQAMQLLLSKINVCPDETDQNPCTEIVLQPELVVRASAS
ncbi:MAG TPA: LacI family transcriptional regulator [Chloroflexi bacterium]|nr:LacI family transcriptional regulator [Chloroflexota bacterium]